MASAHLHSRRLQLHLPLVALAQLRSSHRLPLAALAASVLPAAWAARTSLAALVPQPPPLPLALAALARLQQGSPRLVKPLVALAGLARLPSRSRPLLLAGSAASVGWAAASAPLASSAAALLWAVRCQAAHLALLLAVLPL